MGLIGRLWQGLSALRGFIANLLFLVLLLLLLGWWLWPSSSPTLPARFALTLAPAGVLVETPTRVQSLATLLDSSNRRETVVDDLLRAIDTAAADDRVAALELDASELLAANMVQIQRIGAALTAFRETGKPVLAYGNYLSQAQYLLASYADSVYLHPMGDLLLVGFGSFRPFYANLLERLKVEVNVFRVGRFKSAVEPYLRNDMSPEARTANGELLTQLWGSYQAAVAANREIDAGALDALLQELPARLKAADGDMARLAVESRLVDELLTTDAFEARLADTLDVEPTAMERVHHNRWLAQLPNPADTTKPGVGLLRLAGPISSGPLADMSSGIVAERVVPLIRRAREDDHIRALVVSVDSPGGGVMGSELIRGELELLQHAGKPVVVSMAGVAASGGYWIASTSNHIVADANTLTGSIGIFGVLPTFEATLERIGVAVDGVATHDLAGAMNPGRSLSDAARGVLQAGVEHGYARFLNLVARGRDLPPERVEEIAQGRVWSGARALQLGLVDSLGDERTALAQAAELAGLDPAAFQVHPVKRPETPREALLRRLSGLDVSAPVPTQPGAAAELAAQQLASSAHASGRTLWGWNALLATLLTANDLGDPRGRIALCQDCTLGW